MRKKCFIVTPIGEEKSSIRRHIDGVVSAVLEPVLDKAGFDVFVAHKMSKPGSITKQVMEHVIEDDLVIVNLSEQNPNVMYELGVRHATAKQVIYMCCKDITPKLPFDVAEQRTIFYKDDIMGTLDLKSELEKCIDEINTEDKYTDNPVFNAVKDFKMNELSSSEIPSDKADVLYKNIDFIMNEIRELKLQRSSVIENRKVYDSTISLQVEFDENLNKKAKDSRLKYVKDFLASYRSIQLNRIELMDNLAYFQIEGLLLINEFERDNIIKQLKSLDGVRNVTFVV